jgi:hypothetical protein
VKIENPIALRYILSDDVYLLNNDKHQFIGIAPGENINESPTLNLNYLGGNKKNFLVLVHYGDAKFMDDQHLNALENTLKRLNFELDDVAIFNISGNKEIGFEAMADFFKPQKLLILGKNAVPKGYETLSFNNITTVTNCRALRTFSFSQMMDNTENKKTFWEQMKQL